MAPGQWRQLAVVGLTRSLFTVPGGHTLGYMDKGVYDPRNRQVRFIGHAHYADQRFHQYDEATNTFSNLPDPPWDDGGSMAPSYIGHGYQHNALDPATGDLFYRLFNSTEVHHLRRMTNQWVLLPPAPNSSITGGLEWLSSIGTQGGLILQLGTSVHRWDKAANTWTTPVNNMLTGQTYHTVAVASVPHQVVLVGGGSRKLWKIGATGGATPIPDSPVSVGISSSVTTACPVSGDLLVFGGASNAQFDVAGNTWSSLSVPAGPPFGAALSAGSHIVATPIAPYGVILFVFGNDAVVWVYKHS